MRCFPITLVVYDKFNLFFYIPIARIPTPSFVVANERNSVPQRCHVQVPLRKIVGYPVRSIHFNTYGSRYLTYNSRPNPKQRHPEPPYTSFSSSFSFYLSLLIITDKLSIGVSLKHLGWCILHSLVEQSSVTRNLCVGR